MKKINIILIILVLSVITACNGRGQNQGNQEKFEEEQAKVNKSDPSKYTASGKVIKIDESGLHVQERDSVHVYNVDPARTSTIFIGEYVGINKLDGDNFDVVLDTNHDYNIRITSEGEPIKRITGTVNEVTDDFIEATTEIGGLKLSNPGDFDLRSGDQFIADYLELTGNNQMLSFYDEASKINVEVQEISREANGMMKIFAVSEANVEYNIFVGVDSITNFAHSSLEPGDKIEVYPNDISGDVPAMVDSKLIILVHVDR